MNKHLRMFLMLLGIAIAFLWLFFNNSVVTGEQLCVDGNNNINLEGIMCEKSEWQVYGFSEKQSILVMIFHAIIGLVIWGFALGRKAE